ncbi:MAG: hypothetical protein Q3972_04940 [Corynebacterium sp.]|nr:hypothetical protein [Corynebacterium sp.]
MILFSIPVDMFFAKFGPADVPAILGLAQQRHVAFGISDGAVILWASDNEQAQPPVFSHRLFMSTNGLGGSARLAVFGMNPSEAAYFFGPHSDPTAREILSNAEKLTYPVWEGDALTQQSVDSVVLVNACAFKHTDSSTVAENRENDPNEQEYQEKIAEFNAAVAAHVMHTADVVLSMHGSPKNNPFVNEGVQRLFAALPEDMDYRKVIGVAVEDALRYTAHSRNLHAAKKHRAGDYSPTRPVVNGDLYYFEVQVAED